MSGNNFTPTQDFLKSILIYDKEKGTFSWVRNGLSAGGKCSQGYTRIKILGKTYKAHRLALIYEFGYSSIGMVDHINGNRSDNRIKNLRIITNSGNQLNRVSANTQNDSGFLGVNFNKMANRYAARIQVNGKRVHLGYFLTPEDASEAYNLAKSEMTNSIHSERLL